MSNSGPSSSRQASSLTRTNSRKYRAIAFLCDVANLWRVCDFCRELFESENMRKPGEDSGRSISISLEKLKSGSYGFSRQIISSLKSDTDVSVHY